MVGGSYYVYRTTGAGTEDQAKDVPFFVQGSTLLTGLDWSGQPLLAVRTGAEVRSPEQDVIIQACHHHAAEPAPQRIGSTTVHPGFDRLGRVDPDSVGSTWTFSSSPDAAPTPVLHPARSAFSAHYSRSLAAAPPPPNPRQPPQASLPQPALLAPLLSSMNGRATNQDSLGSDDAEQPAPAPPNGTDGACVPTSRTRDPRLSHGQRTSNGSGSGGAEAGRGGARGWGRASSDGLANGHRSASLPEQRERSEQAREEPRASGAESVAVLQALRAERDRLQAENKELKRQAGPAVRLERELEVAESEVNAKRLKVADLEEQVEKMDRMLDALRQTLKDGPMAF